MREVFIIGSKGIPANYGGFETFVDKLTKEQKSNSIKYNVSCLGEDNNEFDYNGARCFNVKVPNIGPARAVYYDIKAFKKCLNYIEKNHIKDPIIYVLACRIGPFIGSLKAKLQRLGGTLYVNPDGHEWKRAKWNSAIRRYWKLSEKLMVKYADLLICDSKSIQSYIEEDYKEYNPNTTFIAYGANIKSSTLKYNDKKIVSWYKDKGIKINEYYLVVGRFVPENNYETMITEFMKSKSKKDLVLITNVEKNKFFNELKKKTNFDKDKRIKFVGTVYDDELLKKIRENAYGYIHGHEVGGTNPSLLEALATTKLNLLLNVGFNKEVGEDAALYWGKDEGKLSNLINEADLYDEDTIISYGRKAKKRISEAYSWNRIVFLYENVFLNYDGVNNYESINDKQVLLYKRGQ